MCRKNINTNMNTNTNSVFTASEISMSGLGGLAFSN